MYDVIKVDMIKFLMGMFDVCLAKPNGVKQFKLQVETLVNRNQIPYEVRDIVYDMYGITNQDIYKENQQKNKLLQVNYLILSADNIKTDVELEVFKQDLMTGLKNGIILKSAYDVIVNIYGLDLMNNNKRTPVVNNNTNKFMKSNKIKNDEVIQTDIDSLKPEYLDDAYYRYPNPSYDGCTGSSPYRYIALLLADKKPDGAVLCIKTKLSDDGCHVSYGYKPVTSEHLK